MGPRSLRTAWRSMTFAGGLLAGCGPSSSDSSPADSGCVASPVSGAACDQGQAACTPNLPCQPIWTCDSTSHWLEAVPNCVARLPSCVTPTQGATCDLQVPACADSAVRCDVAITWTCDATSLTWTGSPPDVMCDGGSGEAGPGDSGTE